MSCGLNLFKNRFRLLNFFVISLRSQDFLYRTRRLPRKLFNVALVGHSILLFIFLLQRDSLNFFFAVVYQIVERFTICSHQESGANAGPLESHGTDSLERGPDTTEQPFLLTFLPY
jgi:hypothetical protein